MQTAGHLISAAAELTAGMQHCKYDSGSRDTLGMVYCGRNAASVIYNADNVIRKYRYVDLSAVTCESLVNRVINDLINQMMQTALARGADVHARALSYSLKTLQDLYVVSAVTHILSHFIFSH